MYLFELFLLILLVTIILWSIRSGKSVVLDEPIIIHRPGQYHITLAPQLKRAQTFIEQIAKQFALSPAPPGDLPSLYFEVRDPQVFAEGQTCYLLAVAWRGGMLYFQAINPQPLRADADTSNDPSTTLRTGLAGVGGQPGQMASGSVSSSIGQLKTLREFSEAVLALHPLTGPMNAAEAEHLHAAVEWVANQSMVTVKILDEIG